MNETHAFARTLKRLKENHSECNGGIRSMNNNSERKTSRPSLLYEPRPWFDSLLPISISYTSGKLVGNGVLMLKRFCHSLNFCAPFFDDVLMLGHCWFTGSKSSLSSIISFLF